MNDISTTPKVGVGCIVVHDGKVLLVCSRRSGRWSTPGGNLDFGESPAEAAVRETFEEAGVRVRDVGFITITNDLLVDTGRHYVTIWMRAETDDSTIRIEDRLEVSEAGWFDPSELPNPRHLYFENLLAGKSLPEVSWREIVAGIETAPPGVGGA